MRYYVIDLQGAQYGPADIQLLNVWASQGRIVPTTVLVDESSGIQIVAANLPGLQMMSPQAVPGGGPFNPAGATYAGGRAGTFYDGSIYANKSLMYSGISAALCACVPLVGIIPAVVAFFYGMAAKRMGSRQGGNAVFLSIVMMILQVIHMIGLTSALRALGN